MAWKRDKPEDIVMKLRQVEVLQGQGMSVAEAVRQVGTTQQTYYRWRRQYGGMSWDQLQRLSAPVDFKWSWGARRSKSASTRAADRPPFFSSVLAHGLLAGANDRPRAIATVHLTCGGGVARAA
jgi:hypothetical protein